MVYLQKSVKNIDVLELLINTESILRANTIIYKLRKQLLFERFEPTVLSATTAVRRLINPLYQP